MYETEKKEFSFKTFMKRTMSDPVLLYTALIMMSIMYHYRSSLTLVYGIVTYIIGWFLIRLFDFVDKHRFLGALAYGAVGVLSLMCMRACINKGHENYPILWGLWFLTPQTAVQYNKWYTIAVYILFFMFMISVIYYFTRIRYRIFMNFLIFIIPFAIYGKEYEKMPTLLIILLSVCYVLLMVIFRQLQDTPQSQVVCRNEIWKPVAVYAALFAGCAAIVPKPAIEADRTMIETLINADELTDRLDAMLNVFRNTNAAQQYRAKVKDTAVYYAEAEEPLRIKTGTYCHYNFDKDNWSTYDSDKDIYTESYTLPIKMFTPGAYLKAYLYAAELDSDFAQKYGFTEYIGEEIKCPPEKKIKLMSVYRPSDYAPVPQFATEISNISDEGFKKLTASGLLTLVNNSIDGFKRDAQFEFSYSSESFVNMGNNKALLDIICAADYKQLNSDAEFILSKYSDDKKAADCYSGLIEQDRIFFDYLDMFTEKADSSRIKALAKEITLNLDSDYDKAIALESYFYNNGFVYDLDFDTSGLNAENFLFETKTGVCFEYATAMVLLARAADIPARFCVGYNMTDLNENKSSAFNYVISTKDAHAFPELYIKGYGWMSFEPTMADTVEEEDNETATGLLARAGFVILAVTLLVLTFAMLYPRISHRIFMFLSKKKKPAETAEAAMKRICKLYGIGSGCTSQEAVPLAAAKCGADISKLADMFDRAVYGEEELNNDDKQVIMEEYVQAYSLYKESKRKFRRKPANT